MDFARQLATHRASFSGPHLTMVINSMMARNTAGELWNVEAREQLTRLPERFAETRELAAITVTRHGEPVLAVLPYDLSESVMETLEVVGDPELMQALRASMGEIEAGRTLSLEELDGALGL